MSNFMSKREKEFLKQRPFMLTERELRRLHQVVERAEASIKGVEDLELKDIEARLAAAIELPADEADILQMVPQLVPEHLRDAVQRIIGCGGEHVAVAIWCEEDVFDRAKERGEKISREQAQEIISMMDRKHDCELGITWTTIDVLLDDMRQNEVERVKGGS